MFFLLSNIVLLFLLIQRHKIAKDAIKIAEEATASEEKMRERFEALYQSQLALRKELIVYKNKLNKKYGK